MIDITRENKDEHGPFDDATEKPPVVAVKQINEEFRVDCGQNMRVRGEAGDYLIIRADGSLGMCPAATFADRYELIP